MDIPWGSDPARKFVTNVGLITSNGPNGPDVMACEWTHHIAYQPGLILISVSSEDTTVENVRTTREFGISLAAVSQNIIASIAGGTHGRQVDKIGVLKELGFQFYEGYEIKAPMVSGAAMNAECRVIETNELGGNAIFIGEVVHVQSSDVAPLIYHGGKYYKLGEVIRKPPDEELAKIRSLVEKYRK